MNSDDYIIPNICRTIAECANSAVLPKGVILKLGLERPILVSPSMSGSFSVPLVLNDIELISGYVPVAAVKMKALAEVDWAAAKVFALYMYGELDVSIGAAGAQTFGAMATAVSETSPKLVQVFKLNKGFHQSIVAW